MFELLIKKYFLHEIELIISSGSRPVIKREYAFCLQGRGIYLNKDGTTNLNNVVWRPVKPTIWYDREKVEAFRVVIYDEVMNYKINEYDSYLIEDRRYIFMNAGKRELMSTGKVFFANKHYNWKFIER